ncbi:MAG: NADH:flavin oxidoreductase [Candidatus Thermoplasmatota archaeon]|nr:NADH:flavin oxidoreductase [Candidatus Thermoplasmatota archaeon]
MASMDESWTMRNGLMIPNRSVLAAMTNKQSHADGTLSDEEIAFLTRRAKGGFGIITTAASHVQESGQGWEGEFGVWGDHHLPGLTNLATKLKAFDARSFVQIFHGGMRAPSAITGQQPCSASENFISEKEGYSRELSTQEVEETIDAFVQAAKRCESAGFDGVELHGAHGYLIAQFLGSNTNRRSDQFGGAVEHRCTFLLRIIRGIREVVNDKFAIMVRLSPISEEIGIILEDTKQVIELLIEEEIDALHISCWDVFEKQTNGRVMTEEICSIYSQSIPIVSTGSVWSAKDAQFVLDQGAHAVGVARVALPHPDWASFVSNPTYNPSRPPFTPDELLSAQLSPTFVDYMRRWKGFVTDGR